MMNIKSINENIKKTVCLLTIDKLTDKNLLKEYKECKSVKNEIEHLQQILEKHVKDKETRNNIINDYLIKLVPAGTKGVIRGNKFNKLVKEKLENLKFDSNRFEIEFEKKCETCITSEKPDFYVLEKKTNKVIIGMNQLDLWGGGQQINRGYKYIIDNIHNKENSKLLCVICNEYKFKTDKNKAFKLFETGFLNDTLCYLSDIERIIKDYFN